MSERFVGAITLPDGTALRGLGRREPLPPDPLPDYGLYLGRPPDAVPRLGRFWAPDSCSATRRRRSHLIVPGGLPVAAQVSGDALTVLLTVVSDWPVGSNWQLT